MLERIRTVTISKCSVTATCVPPSGKVLFGLSQNNVNFDHKVAKII